MKKKHPYVGPYKILVDRFQCEIAGVLRQEEAAGAAAAGRGLAAQEGAQGLQRRLRRRQPRLHRPPRRALPRPVRDRLAHRQRILRPGRHHGFFLLKFLVSTSFSLLTPPSLVDVDVVFHVGFDEERERERERLMVALIGPSVRRW